MLRLLVLMILAGVRVEGPPDQAAYLEAEVPVLLRQVEEALAFRHPGEVLVKLARTDEEFQRLVGRTPEWVAALAIPGEGTLIVRLAAVGPERGQSISSVLRHELLHLVLPARLGGFRRVPLWFEEGLARLVGGRINRSALDRLPAAAAAGNLIPFAELERVFPREAGPVALAYAQGESLAAFLIEEFGLVPLLDAVERRGSLPGALRIDFGANLPDLIEEWREGLTSRGWWLPLLSAHWMGLLLFTASVLVVIAYLKIRRRSRRIYEDLPE